MAGGPDSTPAFQPWRVSPTTIPAFPTLALTEDEQALIRELQACRSTPEHIEMATTDAYYNGQQRLTQLGIAIPPELGFLRTLVGWPRIAVDPYVERLGVDGFRLAGATDSDPDLHDLWDENGLDAEQSLAFTDALSMRRAYWTIGSREGGGAPLICAESPMNMSVLWATDGRTPRAALQAYYVDRRAHAALYTQGLTLHAAQNDAAQWEIVSRDYHGFAPPIVRMANNPRTGFRDGFSEITPELRSIVDSACRRMLGLEVASEVYSVPQRLILGATADSFVTAEGRPAAAWETYITSVLALERDEDGNLPEVHQFTVYDPSVFTKVIEMYASQAAGMLAATPQDLGLYTDGNPTSAEAAAVSEGRRDRRARRKQATFGVSLVEVMQTALRFQNKGVLPDKFRRMATDWHDVSIETPGITADALTKYTAGDNPILPAQSDVTLKRAGFNAVERAQIAQDRAQDQGRRDLQRIADTLEKGAATPATPPTTPPVTSSGNPDS